MGRFDNLTKEQQKKVDALEKATEDTFEANKAFNEAYKALHRAMEREVYATVAMSASLGDARDKFLKAALQDAASCTWLNDRPNSGAVVDRMRLAIRLEAVRNIDNYNWKA